MKSGNILLTLSCSALHLSACSKIKVNNAVTSERKQMFLNGRWQISAQKATINYLGKDSTVDIFDRLDECEKDNSIVFKSDGAGVQDEGTNICAGAFQTVTWKWAFLNDETRLALIDNNPDTFDIADINTTEMKLKIMRPSGNGVPVHYLYTYKNIK